VPETRLQSAAAPAEYAGAERRKHRRRPSCISLLDCRIDKLTRADVLDWIRFFLLDGRPHQLVTVNPIMLLAAQKDEELAAIFDDAALMIPESSGIRWASEQAGTPLEEIVPGIDLFQTLCGVARDSQRSVFLLGAEPGVAEKAANTLSAKFPGLRIAGTHQR
jgi:N-acetylglucosaminyldiphosphoundecaprenol N-acetyl-beta-D-mannosaminyltransferase